MIFLWRWSSRVFLIFFGRHRCCIGDDRAGRQRIVSDGNHVLRRSHWTRSINVMNYSNLFMFFDLTHIKVYLFAIIPPPHTLSSADGLLSLILKNQYHTHNDKKVRIIQIIFHKVICFGVHKIFHFHENSLVVLFNDWHHCDDSIPATDAGNEKGKQKVLFYLFRCWMCVCAKWRR